MAPIYPGEYEGVWKVLSGEHDAHEAHMSLDTNETTALVKLGVLHSQMSPELAKDLLRRTQSLSGVFDGDSERSIEHSVREHRLHILQLYGDRAQQVIDLLAALYVPQNYPDLSNIWTSDITI